VQKLIESSNTSWSNQKHNFISLQNQELTSYFNPMCSVMQCLSKDQFSRGLTTNGKYEKEQNINAAKQNYTFTKLKNKINK